MISGVEDQKFQGEEGEWLIQYCKQELKTKHYDYFVFGHRHLPLEIDLYGKSTYMNLGDWISHYTYGEFDGNELKLKNFQV